MADKSDTVQVFTIMDALNADESARLYHRMVDSWDSGHLAFLHPELAPRLMDRKWLESFAPGTVGHAYLEFVKRTGYSSAGLAEIERRGADVEDQAHPVAWSGRRLRDLHDLWHILTGYEADEHLGEAALVAFTFAQTKGWGWGAIALATWSEAARRGPLSPEARAIREGWQNGRRAAWLFGEDYERLMAEPLDETRARLRIARPARYLSIPNEQRARALGR